MSIKISNVTARIGESMAFSMVVMLGTMTVGCAAEDALLEEATAVTAESVLDGRALKTLIHAPNGDFTKSHEDSYVAYTSWDGGVWCARIYGNTFEHAPNCSWPAAHTDSVIAYMNWDSTPWLAKLSGKTFTHAPNGDFSRAHQDTVLAYKLRSANWMMKIK